MSDETKAPDSEAEKSRLRQEIMLVVQANNVQGADDILLALAFRTESELRMIAKELHINTRK
jgi:hypothetical protein